jgi:hypothetical protein
VRVPAASTAARADGAVAAADAELRIGYEAFVKVAEAMGAGVRETYMRACHFLKFPLDAAGLIAITPFFQWVGRNATQRAATQRNATRRRARDARDATRGTQHRARTHPDVRGGRLAGGESWLGSVAGCLRAARLPPRPPVLFKKTISQRAIGVSLGGLVRGRTFAGAAP